MQTLPDCLIEALREPREHAIAERLGANDWRFTSTTQICRRAAAIACALRDSGLETGDRVALISNNRVDWLVADFGVLFAGCVVVPIFATLALDQVEYIFKDCEPKLCFVETLQDAERIRTACPHAPRLVHFDGDGPHSFAVLEAAGAATALAHPSQPASFTNMLTPDDVAVLIYTSGTTGVPKGVMLTHGNLVWNATAAARTGLATIAKGEQALTVLPFAHIYEYGNVLTFIFAGCELSITRPEHLLDDLKAVRPQIIAIVPRILQHVLTATVAHAKGAGGLQARLVPWALAVGREFAAARADQRKASAFLRVRYALARRLVLSKIPLALGLDRLKFFASGSAPLHRDVALTFAGMGIAVCEGYGLTETSPAVTFNTVDAIRYGSVGKPIPGVAVRIADDGEILVNGPNVMKGYYHLKEQPFTDDGWFQTGDIGRLDADGYLFITDRKKELIKTSTGESIAPGRIEAALKRSAYIGQCFVVGNGRPYPIALIAPSWELVRRTLGLPSDLTPGLIAERSDVREFIRRQVAETTADLGRFEQIRRVALLPRDLTIQDGELSPTSKVKRRVVERKFAAIIEATYRGHEIPSVTGPAGGAMR
jgi:long-chain acyl-CoA synthetase